MCLLLHSTLFIKWRWSCYSQYILPCSVDVRCWLHWRLLRTRVLVCRFVLVYMWCTTMTSSGVVNLCIASWNIVALRETFTVTLFSMCILKRGLPMRECWLTSSTACWVKRLELQEAQEVELLEPEYKVLPRKQVQSPFPLLSLQCYLSVLTPFFLQICRCPLF